MAKQTIIVMSDSHGDRAIVEEIRNHYIGKVDAIFHNGDSELPSDDEVWQGIQVVAGNMDFYDGYPERLVTDLAGTIIAQTHGHLFHIKSWICGRKRLMQTSVSMVTCISQMLEWRAKRSF